MPQQNIKGKESISKKARARYLLVFKGYNQKEVAALVGVSERTMCVWAKQYKWKEASDKELKKMGGLSTIMEGFILYIKAHRETAFSQQVEKLWGQYLESLQEGTGTM